MQVKILHVYFAYPVQRSRRSLSIIRNARGHYGKLRTHEYQSQNAEAPLLLKYLTIIPRTRVGYELLDSGRGAGTNKETVDLPNLL